MNPLSYTEKRVWVEKYLGLEACKKMFLAPRKDLLIGDYLIDDVIHKGFRGEQIHFGSEKFPNWKTILLYL
jgi:5'(3')-deoxyribonucleotidase